MPNRRYEQETSQQEVRRQREVRAQRRKKRTMQRLVLFAALAVAAALVIFCIVMILRAVFAGDGGAPASGSDTSGSASASGSVSGSGGSSAVQPGVDHPVAPSADEWNLALVNGQRPLPAGHSMAEDALGMLAFGGAPFYYDARIGNELPAMIEACNAATGGSLRIVSGYRGETNQNERHGHLVDVFKGQGLNDADALARADMLEPAAGYSEHQTGLAIDFAVGDNLAVSDDFASTAEYAWLTQNAADYGFILRYTAEKAAITGMSYQPYHWRFVGFMPDGTSIAKTMNEAMDGAGICLEEYLAATAPPNGGDTGDA